MVLPPCVGQRRGRRRSGSRHASGRVHARPAAACLAIAGVPDCCLRGDAPSLVLRSRAHVPCNAIQTTRRAYCRPVTRPGLSPGLLEGAKVQGVIYPGRHPLISRFSPKQQSTVRRLRNLLAQFQTVIAVAGLTSCRHEEPPPRHPHRSVGHALSCPSDGAPERATIRKLFDCCRQDSERGIDCQARQREYHVSGLLE